MTPPENKPIPDDLFPLYVAHGMGAAAYRAGFAITSNGYRAGAVATLAPDRLRAWAWDLGWREAAHVASKSRVKATAMIEARLKEML